MNYFIPMVGNALPPVVGKSGGICARSISARAQQNSQTTQSFTIRPTEKSPDIFSGVEPAGSGRNPPLHFHTHAPTVVCLMDICHVRSAAAFSLRLSVALAPSLTRAK